MATEAIRHKLDSILQMMKENDPDADTNMVERAFLLADEAHKDQKRKSGEPYIMHPVAVAYILATYQMDAETITAALLHDVIEDTEYTHETIAKQFNLRVADLVEGVTKIGKIAFNTKEENQAENLRKMVLAMSKDIRVIIIKLCDRLHNMRTLEYMTPAKQEEKSRETIEIYAPIANRLGIQSIKAELEDLALRYLDSDAYYLLTKEVKQGKRDRETFINGVITTLQEKLEDAGIKAHIYGRAKHFYSIYRKMKRQQRKVDEIYDLMAVRVIVDTVNDCYGALGVVHTLWKPIPGRLKDYIAMPKPNMYQSMHTTVIGPNGSPFEVQIRTHEMHEVAEYGIAAHWKYKEGVGQSKGKEKAYENKIAWIRRMMEWQKDLDAREFFDTMVGEFLKEEVYVFTPKGKVIELPLGSCPLDFAYHIHSDVGNSCVGARVNSKIVPLNYKLNNGDIVEVRTQKNANGPSRDWLKFVKSAHARNKIRQYFKREEKEENIIKGKAILENELKRLGLGESKLGSQTNMDSLREKMGYKTLSDLYAELGYGGLKLGMLMQKMQLMFPEEFPIEEKEIPQFKKAPGKAAAKNNVNLYGSMEGIEVHYAKCCNPVPGDKILGFITHGSGISIHRTDCPNMLGITDGGRILEAEWNRNGVIGEFNATLHIKAQEKRGMLIDLQKVFIEMNIPIIDLSAKNERGQFDYYYFKFDVKSLRELNLLINNIKKMPEIVYVHRV